MRRGRGALQSDRLRNAQTAMDVIVARAKTRLTCGICDAAVALESDPPDRA